ncbi:unnamed protein product [Polarella glacialis]|uniref:WW domain-containing protein n=1 Tax=Polarella glacialis TaxID=89957 RepID=A0A813EAQ0_POLGL|nr:unnamed protein product [Polarella glacialis]
MPGASSGKRSVKAICSRSYEGKSASQQAKAAQWTGQLAWIDADHPSSKSSGGASSSSAWPSSQIDYSKPWFERKDGEFYCNLCGAWATDGHVASDRHKAREDNPGWYGYGDGTVPDGYDKPWFTDKGNREYSCELCNAMATDGHIASDRHKKRAADPKLYGFPEVGEEGATSATTGAIQMASDEVLPAPWVQYISPKDQKPYFHNPDTKATQWERPVPAVSVQAISPVAAASPESNLLTYPPWFEKRQGEWYCKLCNKVADSWHIESNMHMKRASCPEYYGFDITAAMPSPAPSQLALEPEPVQTYSTPGPLQPPWLPSTDDPDGLGDIIEV